MEILKGIMAEDLFLYLKKHHVFIISDIHVGFEESLSRQGIMIPKMYHSEISYRIERALRRFPDTEIIILNGDLVHEFGKFARHERKLVNDLISMLKQYVRIIIIEGNHDIVLKYALDKSIPIKGSETIGNILVVHGDKIIESAASIKTIIIGHEHPAVGLTRGERTERYRCFLKGKYNGKNLIVMPSCNLAREGSDVLRENLLSPYLKGSNITNFEAYIIGDKIYEFGKLKELQKFT